MTNNYVGPGWYWIFEEEDPAWVTHMTGDRYLATHPNVCECVINGASIITHIPRPAQRPVVDWSVMPAWAKWVAVDNGGIWCWYTDEPSINDRHYVVDNGIYGTIPREHAPTYTGDWKNSLVERPE